MEELPVDTKSVLTLGPALGTAGVAGAGWDGFAGVCTTGAGVVETGAGVAGLAGTGWAGLETVFLT